MAVAVGGEHGEFAISERQVFRGKCVAERFEKGLDEMNRAVRSALRRSLRKRSRARK
jgi:hypothetical protein